MDNEILAITLTFLVHVFGIGALIWHLLGQDEERPDWRGWFRPEDDGPEPREPAPTPSGDGLPLPDAVPSLVRLREPALLADAHPRPARRPAHPPLPVPVPEHANEPQRVPERRR